MWYPSRCDHPLINPYPPYSTMSCSGSSATPTTHFPNKSDPCSNCLSTYPSSYPNNTYTSWPNKINCTTSSLYLWSIDMGTPTLRHWCQCSITYAGSILSKSRNNRISYRHGHTNSNTHILNSLGSITYLHSRNWALSWLTSLSIINYLGTLSLLSFMHKIPINLSITLSKRLVNNTHSIHLKMLKLN